MKLYNSSLKEILFECVLSKFGFYTIPSFLAISTFQTKNLSQLENLRFLAIPDLQIWYQLSVAYLIPNIFRM